MQVDRLVDHSPHHLEAKPSCSGAARLVLIDNFDSFTWNIYQYLELEGATVTVYRNDEVSLEELIAFHPSQLVISPGPGNPENDAGISQDAIRHFSGKIPVLGVCMGQQCIFTVFGGKVEVTGEILHGKTSPLHHDGRGLFAGLPQSLPVTRYHSLAGTHPSLPITLELSAWTATESNGAGSIIQGVRHKLYTVEGIQFHPESILTAEGRLMLRNFLNMRGGTWEENEQRSDAHGEKPNGDATKPEHPNLTRSGVHADKSVSCKKPSILQEIFRRRELAVQEQKCVPGTRMTDLQQLYDYGLAPPNISFPDRLRMSPFELSLMAEVKRASPSRGNIALQICAPSQAKEYASAGASVISVLTEPEYFKGHLDDLKGVRRILETMPNRPAILRKEFIFDKYQILEARLAGADTVLLIVKMLKAEQLRRLFEYSRKLGMEPLVEVNTEDEMQSAIDLGAMVIGVNNRNLTNFEVDLDTTSRLMKQVPNDTIVCALSGISSSEDVKTYHETGVKAVLIGEALMKAEKVDIFVETLLIRREKRTESIKQSQPKVKICGTRNVAGAEAAILAGADMIGIILVEGRARTVSDKIGLHISTAVHAISQPAKYDGDSSSKSPTLEAYGFFQHTRQFLSQANRALVVGVFRNATLPYILEKIRLMNLDIVQLHGSEPIEWALMIPVPVIRRFDLDDRRMSIRGYHAAVLLDGSYGGTGQRLNIDAVRQALRRDPELKVILAGGLTPENVMGTLQELHAFSSQIIAVDVSSGVESEGVQDTGKVRQFITAVKGE